MASRTHHCPDLHEPLPAEEFACPNCGAPFTTDSNVGEERIGRLGTVLLLFAILASVVVGVFLFHFMAPIPEHFQNGRSVEIRNPVRYSTLGHPN
jgi:hypothetical protein